MDYFSDVDKDKKPDPRYPKCEFHQILEWKTNEHKFNTNQTKENSICAQRIRTISKQYGGDHFLQKYGKGKKENQTKKVGEAGAVTILDLEIQIAKCCCLAPKR